MNILLYYLGVSFNAAHSITYYKLVIPTEDEQDCSSTRKNITSDELYEQRSLAYKETGQALEIDLPEVPNSNSTRSTHALEHDPVPS